ncbi:MAG: PilN domain-containing protein [Nitrospirae bacterium]|nr:PilN domain-containing protein [Nitrospirota bacterium]
MAANVCYLDSDGASFYKVGKKGVRPMSGGRPSRVGMVLGRKILLLSHGLLYFTREKYPPSSLKNLSGIIANEIGDLFPTLSEPMFHFEVSGAHKNYTMVNVWAWQREPVENIAGTFGYDYIIPEDVLFVSAEPEITVFTHKAHVFAIAHGAGGVVSARVLPYPPRPADFELFCRSLGSFGESVARVRTYLPEEFPPSSFGIAVVRYEPTQHPLSLYSLQGFAPGRFKTSGWMKSLDVGHMSRIPAYALAAYLVASYLSVRGLDNAMLKARDEIKKVNGNISFLAALKEKDTDGKTLDALVQKTTAIPSTLAVMDMVSGVMPSGTYFSRMSIKDRLVEMGVVSTDPTAVIRAFGQSPHFTDVRLGGDPVKDGSGTYRFQLTVSVAENKGLPAMASSRPAPPEPDKRRWPDNPAGVNGNMPQSGVPVLQATAPPAGFHPRVNPASDVGVIIKHHGVF